MAEGPRLRLGSQQRVQLNPGLSQSVGLLRLDGASLTRHLENEAAENPWLRIDPPSPLPPRGWLPRWQAAGAGSFGAGSPEAASAGPSLIAHVMDQVAAMALTRAERQIAHHLVEALEPTGWLGQPLPRIAEAAAAPLPQVEKVLSLLQRVEPRGLFARNLAECLALQAETEGHMDAVMQGVLAGLDLLAKGQIVKLARSIGVSVEAVQLCLQRIRGYSPKPGTLFDPLTPAHSREPDLILQENPKGGWLVTLNRAALPRLRMMATKAPGDEPEGARARAKALVSMLEARDQTLIRVAGAVLAHQGAAILGGAVELVPLTMAQIGEELDLHESTISRAVAGTSMDGPRGVVWLRALFSPGVGQDAQGRGVSKAALKARLVQLIAREGRDARLRDGVLADELAAACGIRLSRRTIAAYREEAGIPIAGRRGLAKTGVFAAKRPERSR